MVALKITGNMFCTTLHFCLWPKEVVVPIVQGVNGEFSNTTGVLCHAVGTKHHRAVSCFRANISSASLEIPSIFRNPKVHHRIHKRPPPDPVLREINPFRVPPTPPPSYFLKICQNIILSFTSMFSKCSLSFMLPHHNPVHTSPLPILTISFFLI